MVDVPVWLASWLSAEDIQDDHLEDLDLLRQGWVTKLAYLKIGGTAVLVRRRLGRTQACQLGQALQRPSEAYPSWIAGPLRRVGIEQTDVWAWEELPTGHWAAYTSSQAYLINRGLIRTRTHTFHPPNPLRGEHADHLSGKGHPDPGEEVVAAVRLEKFLNRSDQLLSELEARGIGTTLNLARADPETLALQTSYRLPEAREDVHRARQRHGSPTGSTTGQGRGQVRMKAPEPASKAWYLAPIFFGILGGLVAYVAVRDQDADMAEACVILGLVLTFLGGVIWVALLGSI